MKRLTSLLLLLSVFYFSTHAQNWSQFRGPGATGVVEGQPTDRPNVNPNGNYEAISPDYFRTMGIRLLAGRDFTAADTPSAPGAVIIDENHSTSHVQIGSTVELEGESGRETYQIVGSAEASPADGRISNESPVGRALLGRKKGDKVTVSVPAGDSVYKIVSIG